MPDRTGKIDDVVVGVEEGADDIDAFLYLAHDLLHGRAVGPCGDGQFMDVGQRRRARRDILNVEAAACKNHRHLI